MVITPGSGSLTLVSDQPVSVDVKARPRFAVVRRFTMARVAHRRLIRRGGGAVPTTGPPSSTRKV